MWVRILELSDLDRLHFMIITLIQSYTICEISLVTSESLNKLILLIKVL